MLTGVGTSAAGDLMDPEEDEDEDEESCLLLSLDEPLCFCIDNDESR